MEGRLKMGIVIKGERNYLIIKIDGEVNEDDIENFQTQLDRNRSFFKRSKVLIRYGGESIPNELLNRITDLLSNVEDVNIIGVFTESAIQNESNAILIKKTLRSGQSISYNGDVVIIGDVNAGAEVIAEGDIIVLGALRGLAHAGAMGNRDAIICALEFSPVQIRIADVIARSPEQVTISPVPEIARIKDNNIIIESLLHGGIR